MPKPSEPIELVLAKGKKHLTKAEIAERKSSEIKPIVDGIEAPAYLTKAQARQFDELAKQLKALNIMGVTDVDALARYVLTLDLYISISKQIRKREIVNNPYLLDKYLKNQDRAFRQVRSCASDLGLTITSRCKLVVPTPQQKERSNKFEKFEKRTAESG